MRNCGLKTYFMHNGKINHYSSIKVTFVKASEIGAMSLVSKVKSPRFSTVLYSVSHPVLSSHVLLRSANRIKKTKLNPWSWQE